jgi:hypothetical protein
MQLTLPQVKIFEQDPQNYLYGWSDQYGALCVASMYCKYNIKLSNPIDYFVWHHGCHGPWESIHPGLITYNLKNKNLRYFVASKEQEIFLKENGYKNAKAIGLPIVYVERPKLNRIPESLLIMPSHSLLSDYKKDKVEYNKYIEDISKYIVKYKHVYACLHHNCIANNMWVEEFNALGVHIIEGARTDDKNAYLRQAYIFSQFENMTTNSWGSHVAYALHFGVKVSIYGHVVKRTIEEILKDGTWSRDPKTAYILYDKKVNIERNQSLMRFMNPPDQCVEDVPYGNTLVGFENKLSPEDLKSLITGTFNYKFKYYKLRLINNLYRAYKNITSAK